MKSTIYLLVTISFLAISCDKRDAISESENDISLTNIKSTPNPGIIDKLITNFPDLGDVWCGAQPLNCFRPVVITPSLVDKYNILLSLNESGELSDFFRDYDWKSILPEIESEVVEAILDGRYNLYLTNDSSDSNQKILVICQSGIDLDKLKEDDVIYGIPLKY